MKRKYYFIGLSIILSAFVVYYGIIFYRFGKGVIDDAKQGKNFNYIDTIKGKANDSLSYVSVKPIWLDSNTVIAGSDTINLK